MTAVYEPVISDQPPLGEHLVDTITDPVQAVLFIVLSIAFGWMVLTEMGRGSRVARFAAGTVAGAVLLTAAFTGLYFLGDRHPIIDDAALEANLAAKYAVTELVSGGDEATAAVTAFTDATEPPVIGVRVEDRDEALRYGLQVDPDTHEPYLVGIPGTHSPDPDSLLRAGHASSNL